MVEGARLESVCTANTVPRVRISHSPPWNFGALPCNALLYSLQGRTAALGSRAMEPREPRQARKGAAVNEPFHVPRGRLGAAARR